MRAASDPLCEQSRDDPISLDVPELMQGLNNIDRIWKEYSRYVAHLPVLERMAQVAAGRLESTQVGRRAL